MTKKTLKNIFIFLSIFMIGIVLKSINHFDPICFVLSGTVGIVFYGME